MDCVVDSADSYVDLAVRLANDAGFRATVKARILETNGALFEDARVVREFERFFRESLAQAR
jgi:predicted O-linked N-acetylglucosamine transferase (SPINDLY family)